ncbi:hypothetical protein FD755_006039 [Muntiacus reevesi]|uniref:Ig-like domain-containing protein n=1 Tax=Muntiacus reevesi TaxID=9886 RepID=A0A5J5MXH2_MUNRE|nr:hypothetical protein FD755_006039 [Muntiacus reevesi]
MAPGPSTLLGLDLCSNSSTHTRTHTHTHTRTLPRPSISAEPGSVVPWGRPVSIVCRGPAGVRSFLLEKDDRSDYKVVGVTSRGEQETEARFHITALREDAVGRYCCIYETESGWSERSEALSRSSGPALLLPVSGSPGPQPLGPHHLLPALPRDTTSVRNSVKGKCVCVSLQRYIYLHRLLLVPPRETDPQGPQGGHSRGLKNLPGDPAPSVAGRLSAGLPSMPGPPPSASRFLPPLPLGVLPTSDTQPGSAGCFFPGHPTARGLSAPPTRDLAGAPHTGRQSLNH